MTTMMTTMTTKANGGSRAGARPRGDSLMGTIQPGREVGARNDGRTLV